MGAALPYGLTLLVTLLLSFALPGLAVAQQSDEALARQRIREFERAVADNDVGAARVAAFEISSDYRARRLLKSPEFQEIGSRYFGAWFDEGDGMIHEIIARARGKLSGRYSSEILARIGVIQNESSRLARKAPMDFDVGILTGTREEAVKLLHEDLGGPRAVVAFHDDLQAALEESYRELYRELGGVGGARPKRAFIAATTAWHPEAYADARVLGSAGVAGKDLVQQTADVSRYKIAEMRGLVGSELTLGEALEEAARGTIKDLDKLDRVFQRVGRITGVAPELKGQLPEVRQLLAQVAAQELDPIVANVRIMGITGKDLFESCNDLIDTMEAAWTARRVKPQEKFLALLSYHLDDAEFNRAYSAVLQGNVDELSSNARRFVRELQAIAEADLVRLSDMSSERFLAEIAKQFPDFWLASAVNEQSLRDMIQAIREGAAVDDLADVFGRQVAQEMGTIRSRVTAEVKSKLRSRFLANGLDLFEVDKNGWTLLGDTGSTLKFDAGIGIAMGFWTTSQIMDQNLSPDEEYRQLINAWGTALPIVGDVAMGINELGELTYGGEAEHLFKAGAWLTIGAAGFVPGAQLPALIAGLGLMGYEGSGMVVDVNRDRELVQAWIGSGTWDRPSGTLLELLDDGGGPHALTFEDVVTNGDTRYLSGLTNWSLSTVPSRNVTMRESLYLWVERNELAHGDRLGSFLRPLEAVYPAFPFRETLREPWRTARSLFAAAILEAGGDPRRSLEMILFRDAKTMVDDDVAGAIKAIKRQAELEYQALYHVGAAQATFRELEELGRRLDVPLVDNVNTIFAGFESFVWESLKTPFVRDSLPRRKVMLAERYLEGYRKIEASLTSIRSMFERASIQPPRFNLSGYLEVDAPRVSDLEAAYANVALGDAMQQTQQLHRDLTGRASYVVDRSRPAPCDDALFRQLAGIGVRLVEAEDRRLLLEAWSGNAAAAETSRDEALRRAQASTEEITRNLVIYTPRIRDWSLVWDETELPDLSDLPLLSQWKEDIADLDRAYATAHAWASAQLEGSQVYQEAIETQNTRLAMLREQRTRVLEAAPAAMVRCLVETLNARVELSDDTPEAGDSVTARLLVSEGEVPARASWSWSGSGGVAVVGSSEARSTLVAQSDGSVAAVLTFDGLQLKRFEVPIRVTATDESDEEESETAEEPEPDSGTGADATSTDARGWRFAGTATSNWTGSNDPSHGLHLSRETVRTGAGSANCDWEAHLDGQLWARLDSTFFFSAAARDAADDEARREEIRADLEEELPEHASWHREAAIRAVSLGEFSGYMLDTQPAYVGGSWGSGYTEGSSSAFGHGYVVHDGRLIELEYAINGGGCFDNTHERYLMANASAAQQEAQAILSSLRLVPDGAIASSPWAGPPKVADPLTVELIATPERPSFLGESVGIEARVRGGVPPYSYAWTGDHAGQGAQVSFASRSAGVHPLAVTVTDAEGNGASSTISVTVEAVSVRVSRTSAGTLRVGEPVGFRADVEGGPQSGLVLLWQPHPEVEFSPFERALTTSAQFPSVGAYKVWAEVFFESGGQRTLVGESEQLELEVLPPELSLVVEPAEPLVSQEVRVSLQQGRDLPQDLVDFWWEVQGDARGAGAVDDNRAFTFYPSRTADVTIIAHGKAMEDGADLGQASITIRARPYQVTIPEPTLSGPTPQRWDPASGGLLDVPRAIAVDGEFGLTAAVSPTPPDTGLRFEWRVAPDGLSLFSPDSQSTTVRAERKGEFTVSVEVSDSSGTVLGSGSRSVSVTISREDMQPPTPAAGSGPDLDPIADLIDQGRTDEAAAALAGLSGRDADAAAPLIQQLVAACNAKLQAALAARDYDAAEEQVETIELVRPGIDEARVGRLLVDQYRKYEAEIASFLATAGPLLDAGRYWDAEEAVSSAQRVDAVLPPPPSARVTAAVARFESVKAEYAAFVEPLRRQWSQAWDEERWEDCLEIFDRLEVRPLNVEDSGWVKIMRPELQRMIRARPAEPSAAPVSAPSGTDTGAVTDSAPDRPVPGSSIVDNAEEVVTLDGLGITSASRIRLLITEASGLTATNQRADSARVGEVEFYRGGTRIMPTSVTAESVFPGYGAEQASDGNRQYRYVSDGAQGWASAEKGPHSATWIDFVFASPVDVDTVVVTTAPSDPYRLHGFELAVAGPGTDTAPATASSGDRDLGTLTDATEGSPGRFAGAWGISGGPLGITVEGNRATGTYPYDSGRISGTIQGSVLTGTWAEAPTYAPPQDAGDVELTLSEDGMSISGRWRYGSEGEWRYSGFDGPRVGGGPPAPAPAAVRQGVLGLWDVFLNGQPFTLEIGGTPGNLTGVLSAGAHVEPLDAVSFDAATSILRFARPIGGGSWQLYTGSLQGDHLEGFFEAGPLDGGFEQGTYRWQWNGQRKQQLP